MTTQPPPWAIRGLRAEPGKDGEHTAVVLVTVGATELSHDAADMGLDGAVGESAPVGVLHRLIDRRRVYVYRPVAEENSSRPRR